ncbi:MAG: DUF4091 domain-containing protein, partial [Deltaproteobacteria bacterium]|nr:DUF4091 domain-containing protein [Deltaproteobacteria bacterium]
DIVVEAGNGDKSTIGVTLDVWNLDLPDMTSVASWFIFRPDSLVDYHSGIVDQYGWLDWTERPRMITKRYEELAHTHRIDTSQHFIHNPENGCAPPISWATYDNEIAPYMDGTYFEDGVPSTQLTIEFSPGAPDWGMGSECNHQQYTALAKAWADHLREKDWFDRSMVLTLDEPGADDIEGIATQATWMAEGDPGWKDRIISTVTPYFTYTEILNPAIGTYVVTPNSYSFTDDETLVDSQGDAYGRFTIDELFDQGISLWFYESNSVHAPYPGFATNSLDGAEPEMLMWGSWFERATGFLYWSVNYWNEEEPWGPNYENYKTGEGVLLYPGHHDGELAPAGSPADVGMDGPVPSYRLKAIRTGLQDWALFALADELSLGEYARQQVGQVYGQFGECEYPGCAPSINGFYWTTDAALMDEVRYNIASAIIAASP